MKVLLSLLLLLMKVLLSLLLLLMKVLLSLLLLSLLLFLLQLSTKQRQFTIRHTFEECCYCFCY